jgi:hypothetical protein
MPKLTKHFLNRMKKRMILTTERSCKTTNSQGSDTQSPFRTIKGILKNDSKNDSINSYDINN